MSSIPGWGRYPGKGNNYPLQYSCLVNSMNRGAWQATVCYIPLVLQQLFLATGFEPSAHWKFSHHTWQYALSTRCWIPGIPAWAFLVSLKPTVPIHPSPLPGQGVQLEGTRHSVTSGTHGSRVGVDFLQRVTPARGGCQARQVKEVTFLSWL